MNQSTSFNNRSSHSVGKGKWKVHWGLAAIALSLVVLLLSSSVTWAILSDNAQSVENVFFSAPKHILTYHSNVEGEEIEVPKEQVEYGEGEVTFAISDMLPVRGGFVFVGWNTQADGNGTEVDRGGSYTTEAAQSDLYAQWEAGYSLIYHANGGTNEPDPVTVVSAEASHTFNNLAQQGDMTGPPEKDGTATHRVFLGWSEDPAAEVPTYSHDKKWAYTGTDFDGDNTGELLDAAVIEAASNPEKTVHLYAVWATKYILTYEYHPELTDPPCGTVLPKTQTWVTRAATHVFKLPAESDDNRPTRSGGYRWGWWGDNLTRFGYAKELPTSAPVNEGCYLFGESIKALSKDAPTQTLYAYFQPPNEATVLFDKNISWMPDRVDREATVENMPDPCYGWTTEHEYIPWEDGVPTNIPTHPRYTFQGWATTPNATEPEVMPGQKDFSINMVLHNEVTLYAVWKAGHNYQLHFDYNGSYSSIYYKDENGAWIKKDYSTSVFVNSENVFNVAPTAYFTDSSYTWTKAFFQNAGVFATKSDDGSTSNAWTYKFLGWSLTKQAANVDPQALTIEFPVTAPQPKDLNDPRVPDTDSITGDIGLITQDVTFDEPNESCTRPTTHKVYLYAVWQKSPKHQLALVFNRGGATSLGGTLNYYDPASNKYVASADLMERVWSVEKLKNVGVPTKAEEDTATYEFIGWSDTNLPNGVGTMDDVTVTVDPTTKKVNQAVTVKEPKEHSWECEGGRHTRDLYPVFAKTARHKYAVHYDVNAPSTASTVVTTLHQSDDGSSWTHKQVVTSRPNSSQILNKGTLEEVRVPLSVQTYSYSLMGKGMYATCVNTSPNSTSNYTFLGWSYTQYALGEWNETEHGPLEFPVGVPADPMNPGAGEGMVTADVVINEADENPQCSEETNEGYVHERTLYGVWAGEPLHQYAVVFVGNGSGSQIQYGSLQNWADEATQTANETIAAEEEDFTGTGLEQEGTGKLAAKLENTWRVYSDAFRMPTEPSDPEYSKTYTFDSNFWQNRDLIVKATRSDSANARYTFVGWATSRDASAADVVVDANGYITSPLTVTDTHYPCSSETHHTVLYAVWEETKIHNFQLVFSANGGNQIGYQDGNNWRYNSSSYAPNYSYSLRSGDVQGVMNAEGMPTTMYYTARISSAKNPVSTFTGYTWSEAEGNRIRLEAKRPEATESGNRYKFTFVGWSPDPNATTPTYTVDASSNLNEAVTLNAGHGTDSCDSSTHTMVLYAVWNKELIPKQHRFALSFNLNGGTRFRQFDSDQGQWKDVSSFPALYSTEDGSYVDVDPAITEYTWPLATWQEKGLGGARRDPDTYWNYEFMGWSTTPVSASENPDLSNCIAWEHDGGSENAGDGFITAANVTAKCPATHSGQTATCDVKLHAVWKRTPRTKTYTLNFNVNAEAGQGVDPLQMTGTETYDSSNGSKWNTHTFNLEGIADPTNKNLVFAGWNVNPNASSGLYGNPYTGEDADRRSLTAHLVPSYTTSPALANNVYSGENTLYAIWLYEYELVYDANGGSNAPPHMHAYDRAPQKTTRLRDVAPTWEGHEFLGWSTDAGATDPMYSPNEQITIHAEENGTVKMTLYAVWKTNE